MSKDEFLKIQTCVLKVNIHCDGCKDKVKKILQKIEGVYTTKIDSELGKVTVSGNVDSSKLIKKLIKNGKHAELWGAPKSNNQLNNQFNNLKIDNKKGGGGGNNNNKGHVQKNGGGNNNNQPKGGSVGGGQNHQLPQMKGLQDLKLPPQFMKDMKLPFNNNNQKSVKFKLPEDEDLSDEDDDFDDFDDDDDYDDEDDEFDDEMDDVPLNNKAKPALGNNGHGYGSGPKMPNMMMMNNMLNAANNNGKKGGDGNIPIQMNGKKGGNNGNSNNSGGDGGNKGGKSGGEGKNSGGKKTNDGPKGMIPNNMMMAMNGQKGNFAPQMGHMGNNPLQTGNMGHNLRAVQGLPASGFPEQMANNNNNYQQQLAAMMMSQQRANGNERFQPMMYARPPPSVSYMPQPYPYYPPPPGERVDQYSMFSDEDTTSSCAIM